MGSITEVFGPVNSCAVIAFAKSSSTTSEILPSTCDYLLWYARDKENVKFHQPYAVKNLGGDGGGEYSKLRLADGAKRQLTDEEIANPNFTPEGAKVFRHDNLVSQGFRQYTTVPFGFEGRTYHSGPQLNWKTTVEGLRRLAQAERIEARANSLAYVRYFDDFPVFAIDTTWSDTGIAGRRGEKLYVVQTTPKVIERCLLMTTGPGDLVLDPTCGSGTTAYVAEQWGRRWITIDTSRVALALARTRLMAARFPYYLLADSVEGRKKQAELTGTPTDPSAPPCQRDMHKGFVYRTVPHVTLKSIANNPDITEGMTR
jgi:adenine-specific DNA-methyltransferase